MLATLEKFCRVSSCIRMDEGSMAAVVAHVTWGFGTYFPEQDVHSCAEGCIDKGTAMHLKSVAGVQGPSTEDYSVLLHRPPPKPTWIFLWCAQLYRTVLSSFHRRQHPLNHAFEKRDDY